MLNLNGGALNLTSGGTYDSFGGLIRFGAGGAFAAASGTLSNVTEILSGVSLTLISGTPLPLTMNSNGILAVAGSNSYSAARRSPAARWSSTAPSPCPARHHHDQRQQQRSGVGGLRGGFRTGGDCVSGGRDGCCC